MAQQTIRLFQPHDAPRCVEIIAACLPLMDGFNAAALTWIATMNTPEQVADELSSYETLVCEAAGVLMGLGALAGHEIKRVYVHPKNHGNGIGQALMAALEQCARANGVRQVRVEASLNGEGFYEKLGYGRVRPGSFRTGEAVLRFIVMTKELA